MWLFCSDDKVLNRWTWWRWAIDNRMGKMVSKWSLLFHRIEDVFVRVYRQSNHPGAHSGWSKFFLPQPEFYSRQGEKPQIDLLVRSFVLFKKFYCRVVHSYHHRHHQGANEKLFQLHFSPTTQLGLLLLALSQLWCSVYSSAAAITVRLQMCGSLVHILRFPFPSTANRLSFRAEATKQPWFRLNFEKFFFAGSFPLLVYIREPKSVCVILNVQHEASHPSHHICQMEWFLRGSAFWAQKVPEKINCRVIFTKATRETSNSSKWV